jgi:iron complex transport system ATP-binding protein
MSTALSAQNLFVTYDSQNAPILNGVSVDIRHGELTGIVGPNGSGKSTLVRALSRTLRPTHGLVLLDGRNLYEVSARESASTIGVVPQSAAIAFDFTVRDLVEMGRSPRMPAKPFASLTARDAQIVSSAMSSTGTDHLAGRIANTLSGGELQRCLIARALAQEPDVLLLDEPTAHLDLQHQLGILELVRKLAHEDGKAVMVVLHDLNLAAAYCDRIVLAHGGKVASAGRPHEVLTAENVMAAYGTRVWMRAHPTSGRPYLVTLPELEGVEESQLPGSGPAVHLVCGGGSGTGAMVLLRHQGCTVTAGPLNQGDTDQEAAESLGIDYTQEAPFTEVSASVLQASEELSRAADIILVTEVPFGHGNVTALRMALARRKAGQPVWMMDTSPNGIENRDFTGGQATDIWRQLVEERAIVIEDLSDLARMAREWKESSIAD